MMHSTTLQMKLLSFEEGLTELERVRLAQLLRTDFKGSLLIGGAGKDTETVGGVPRELKTEERSAVNANLSNKLMTFQEGLNESELTELLSRLSASGKRQSSFGASD